MTNVLRAGHKIVFSDNVEREIFPLTIRQLRKFLKAMEGLNVKDVEDTSMLTDDQIDKMMEAARVVLEKDYRELCEDPDGLEDIVDLKSFNELIATAMGADPNV